MCGGGLLLTDHSRRQYRNLFSFQPYNSHIRHTQPPGLSYIPDSLPRPPDLTHFQTMKDLDRDGAKQVRTR